ncbi:MAG TPA: hypothetical protein VFP61_06810 [Acidimicrobiales bacterium]|nr:hypothetical protein [Acidimicrobiales bacterium]
MAASEADAARLAHTAAVLRAIVHPGVVELVDAPASGERLVTRWAGDPLDQRAPLTTPEVAGLGAAAATVLADVHSLGWAHGNVGVEHLLVADDGRPTWCGWGAATAGGDPTTDVVALASVLRAALPVGAALPRRLARALADAAAGRLDAAALARRLGDPRLSPVLPAARATRAAGDAEPSSADAPRATPEGQAGPAVRPSSAQAGGGRPDNGDGPPGTGPGTRTGPGTGTGTGAILSSTHRDLDTGDGGDRRPLRWRPRRRVGLAAAAVASAGLAASVVTGGGARAAACPAADRGCRALPAGTATLRSDTGTTVVVAGAGDVVALGRWRCSPQALPAVLDPRTGQVWVYDRWATPGDDVTAQQVAVVGRARSLRVVPGAACDGLAVERAGAPDVTVLGDGRR